MTYIKQRFWLFFFLIKKEKDKPPKTWQTHRKQQCLPPIGCGTYWRASFIFPLFSGLRVIAEVWNEKKIKPNIWY